MFLITRVFFVGLCEIIIQRPINPYHITDFHVGREDAEF